MITYKLKAGSTDVSVVVRIVDNTTGLPETGLVFNSAGMDMEYRREGGGNVNITEVTLASLSTAHADGGFLEIGNGYYRLDLPDAAVASGASGVLVHGTVTGAMVIGCYIQLVAYDPFDAGDLGLTALTGHTPQTGDSFARLGAPAGASIAADLAAIEAQTDDIGAAGAGLTAIPWNAAWDAEVQSEVTDALNAYDPPTQAEIPTAAAIADAVWDEQTWDHRAPGTAGAAIHPIDSNQAQAGSTATTIVLNASHVYGDDDLNGCVIQITDGTGYGQARIITDYVGATDTATVSPAWEITPDDTSEYVIHRGVVNVATVESAAVTSIQSGLATAASLTTVEGKIDTVDTVVDAILVDTGTTLDGKLDTIDGVVDAILVDTGTTLDGKIDTIDANVDSVLADTGTDGVVVAAASKTGYALSSAGVDAIWDEPLAEPAGVFNWATTRNTFRDAFQFLFALGRNKIKQTATTATLRTDADDADIATATDSEDGTTFTRGEWG